MIDNNNLPLCDKAISAVIRKLNQLEQAAARCEKAVYAEEIEVQKYIQSVLFDKKVALMVEIEEGEQK